ncbi:MAG: hypothetical protein ABIJ56_19700 [Pseudomonadota bacterium]
MQPVSPDASSVGPEANSETSANIRTVRIGGDVSVELLDPAKKAPAGKGNEEFEEAGCSSTGCALRLEVIHGPLPRLDDLEPVFDSTSLWKVFKQDGSHVFELPHLRAVVDFESGSGRIYVEDGAAGLSAFDYPLDEVIFSRLLADKGSIIVHACGIDYRGRGMLFCGASGAGKSTLADLFSDAEGAAVLSDDRVAAGIRDGSTLISGTPWHGTSGRGLNRTVPLERIFFLHHAPENRIEPVPASDAAARLASLSVIPYWHAGSAKKALDAAVDMAGSVPASSLGFVPGPTAVEICLDRVQRPVSTIR